MRRSGASRGRAVLEKKELAPNPAATPARAARVKCGARARSALLGRRARVRRIWLF